MKISKRFFYLLYYLFFSHLPQNDGPFGRIGRILRRWACRHLFEYCGSNVSIDKGAVFGKGDRIRIGDNSGIGAYCTIPNGSIIGDNVMMGRNVYILSQNHRFDRLDIPMSKQGFTPPQPVVIDDDVWIGNDVRILLGRHIARGSIIGLGSVLTKDFPEYSIVGGNPAKLIGSRIKSKE
jgi:maltose O-acetyltransferase